MKTIAKIFTTFSVIFFATSCNNDDNAPAVQKDQFVKQIVSTSTSTPSTNQTILFNYDSQNRISDYTITKTGSSLSHTLTYNSNGFISSINRIATSSTTTANTTFNFVYASNGILTQLIIPGTTTTTMNFTYDAVQKKYIGNDGAGYVVEIKLDAIGNIKQFVNSIENSNVSYSSNSGIFKNNTNCLPIFLTHFFSSEGNSKYIAQLFSNKEITAIEGATTTLTTTTTRNSNNFITQIKYGTSASTIFTADFTYEERNI